MSDQVVKIMKGEFQEAMLKLPAILEYKFTTRYSESNGVFIGVLIELMHPENVIVKTHNITLACYDLDWPENYGIDYDTPDSDTGDITPENIMVSLYFDLSLKETKDEDLH